MTAPDHELSDHDARRLLQAAADTVHVDPAGPIEPPGSSRRWPALVAAAAAVVAVLVVTTLLATRDGKPDPVVKPTPNVVVPSVLGYDDAEARTMLEALGLEVTGTSRPSCSAPQGLSLGISPAAGTTLLRGATVELAVSSGPLPTGFCDTSTYATYELLRFARGLGPAPRFADGVWLFNGDGPPTTLSRTQAADPAQWTACNTSCVSPLAELVRAADATYPTSGGPFLPAELTSGPIGAADSCGPQPRPGDVYGLPGRTMGIALGGGYRGPCLPPVLEVYSSGRQIQMVVVHAASSPGSSSSVTVPPVFGRDVDTARAALEDLGLRVRVKEGCYAPPGVATGTIPATGSAVTPGRRVLLDTGSTACPESASRQRAWELIRFALGEQPAPGTWACEGEGCQAALDFLAAEASRALPVGDGPALDSPELSAYPVTADIVDDGRAPCTGPLPAAMRDGSPVEAIRLGRPFAADRCPARVVLVHRTDGLVDQLAVVDSPRYRADPGVPTVDDPRAADPPSDRARAAADAFIAFARGEGAPPEVTDPLPLYVGHQYAGLVSPGDAGDPSAYLACPVGSQGYAGLVCDLSAVDTLRDHRGALAFSRAHVQNVCSGTTDAARADLGTDTVTIAGGESCGGGLFAVTLGVDDTGRLTGVDLALGEP